MSFTGDLEHLPIVDVIQLLHATRKSGILRVKGRKGESQLVFKDGFLVSANHLNNSVLIGKILSDLHVITPAILDQALQEQINAGQNRKPLIITLIEKGHVKEEDAYKGLEQLIELTIVEILTWKKGTFTLDVLPQSVADEYRYYPGEFAQEINVNTQSILMDALRIYDEKMRDGELPDEDAPEEDIAPEGTASEEDRPNLSADDLGLADFDQLERKIPGVFKSLDEPDPRAILRRKIAEVAPELALTEQEELVSFLGSFSSAAPTTHSGPAQSVIFFSADELLKYAVPIVCKQAGILVFTTNEELDLEPILSGALAKNRLPLLVFDSPHQSDPCFTAEKITSVRQQLMHRHPQCCAIQLAAPGDALFSLQSYLDGVRAVIPRPFRMDRQEPLVVDTVRFLETFQAYLRGSACNQETRAAGKLRRCCMRLRDLKEAPEVARALLEFVAGMFDRALTLIVRDSELIAERSVGVRTGKNHEVSPPLGFRIPLANPSLLRNVIEKGKTYFGIANDEVIREHLFTAIGVPERTTVLLLPIRNHGKTIAITYGDYGNKEISPVNLDLLEILAGQAELVLDNALYEKKLENLLKNRNVRH